MFLNGLKIKSILRKLEAVGASRQYVATGKPLKKVGFVQEMDRPFDEQKLVVFRKTLGVHEKDLKILNYKEVLSKEESAQEQLFCDKHVGWKAVLKPAHIKDFCQTDFDLLVSFYSGDQLALKALTSASKAVFKVGISSDLEGLHDLVIHTKVGDETVFIKELNRYLEILKVK